MAGPLALLVYFAAPFFAGWPFSGGSPVQLAAYATAHQTFFFAGAWFQVTGALLSIAFFLILVQASGTGGRAWGMLVLVASTALLSVVVVEAAFLVEVPIAAGAGDIATAATAFAMVNGPFARVVPLAPTSAAYVGLGALALGSLVLDRRLGYAAIGIGVAFEAAGSLAVLLPAGLFAAIAISTLQPVWIVVAAVDFARTGSAKHASLEAGPKA